MKYFATGGPSGPPVVLNTAETHGGAPYAATGHEVVQEAEARGSGLAVLERGRVRAPALGEGGAHREGERAQGGGQRAGDHPELGHALRVIGTPAGV
jgi:hypothetical protein